ncbi:MAG: CDP-diacylglycerol--glycerol-3-phosphate 3-phosphatidyltransferase [Fuerstiella sp.]|nr:CDP-diacylglycerol--glycerol-3-phosphate 3-phosphatidyltransferase [Fuerstiella sp.]
MTEDTNSDSVRSDSIHIGRESLNLPNLVTLSRLVLAAVLFALIDSGRWWIASSILFVFAASTDALDGWLARRSGQITTLGRILDPFVDKIIVGGTFLFLLSPGGERSSGVTPWMVITVIGREMFVSSLRGFLEQSGHDFSASFIGKTKMVLQCVAVTVALISLAPELDWPWLIPVRDFLLWLAVCVTLWSGLIYVIRGITLLNRKP